MKTEERATVPVTMEPLISTEERRFIDGNLSADVYLSMGQREAEREAELELAHQRHRQFRWLSLIFSTLAAGVYVVTSLVFLFVEKSSFGSVTAAVFGVGFGVLSTALSASTRHAQRKREHRRRLLNDA
ncbi:hypothetical protein [Micromonospora chersina]|uniref:hypothetical protein n=1 Tax=Micromonospora chersina TaxID=47854 RepID=UPI003D8E5A6A